MEQKCENCKWKEAPCKEEHCWTFRNNEELSPYEFNDHWTPAKPWEDKWIVPEGCEILAETGSYYIGTIPGESGGDVVRRAAKWEKNAGVCFVGHRATCCYILKLKKTPIEETPEFEAWRKFCGITKPFQSFAVSSFKDIQKIFKMELKQAD